MFCPGGNHSLKKRYSLKTGAIYYGFLLLMEINLKFIWRPTGGAWCKVKRESTGDFCTGDDLDDLFMLIDGGYLDGDVALNEQIDAIAAEVASNENNITGFLCIHC